MTRAEFQEKFISDIDEIYKTSYGKDEVSFNINNKVIKIYRDAQIYRLIILKNIKALESEVYYKIRENRIWHYCNGLTYILNNMTNKDQQKIITETLDILEKCKSLRIKISTNRKYGKSVIVEQFKEKIISKIDDVFQTLIEVKKYYMELKETKNVEIGNEEHSADEPPPRKEGYDYSEQVLVYYSTKNIDESKSYKYGIAYYHYDLPFDGPQWIDFDNLKRVPSCWWELPVPSKE